MAHSLLFAKSIALLLEEVQTVTDLTMVRSGLHRVRSFSRSHGLSLELSEARLSVNGVRLQRTSQSLQRLMIAMATHSVGQITISAGAVPRELLKLAMLLGRKRSVYSTEPSIFEELRDAALWYVRVSPEPRAIRFAPLVASDADMALDTTAKVTVRVGGLHEAARTATETGDAGGLVIALATLATVEDAMHHPELRALCATAFTAAATTPALRLIITSLPHSMHLLGNAMLVMERAGEEAAEILIEQLSTSDSIDVRRACFDALVDLRRGTGHLVKLLKHEQWFVARNAACLLGEFASRTSEPELTDALEHSDERVRSAIVTALLHIDTHTSRATVRAAVRDASPEVRRRAARGFLAEKGEWTNVNVLLQALECESDLDVQLEFLYALGTLATPDAVQRLIRLCSAEGSHRPTEFRIAAAEALTSARLSAAVPMLRTMLKDPDVHARAAARHLIRAVS